MAPHPLLVSGWSREMRSAIVSIRARAVPSDAPRVSLATAKLIEWKFRFNVVAFHVSGVHSWVPKKSRLVDAGTIKTRLYVMLRGSLPELTPFFARGPVDDVANHRLAVRAVKIYADGALGSRGAALLEPYADEPATTVQLSGIWQKYSEQDPQGHYGEPTLQQVVQTFGLVPGFAPLPLRAIRRESSTSAPSAGCTFPTGTIPGKTTTLLPNL